MALLPLLFCVKIIVAYSPFLILDTLSVVVAAVKVAV